MHHNLGTVILIAWLDEHLTPWQVALHTWLRWGSLPQVHQCWESSFQWVQSRVTAERSEPAQPDDTTCIFAILQPLVDKLHSQRPRADKCTWKERSWHGLVQVPSARMLYSLRDSPGKVWRSFCCSVLGQKEVMDEQKNRGYILLTA